MKYKVLLINKYHYIKGGSETYHFALGDLLQSKGHKVVYFAMEDEKNFPCEYSGYFSKNRDFNSKLSFVEKIKAGFSALYSYDAKKKIERLIKDEKPDIVHINLVHRHITLSVVDGIKKFGLPIVLTAHDSNCICPNHIMFANEKVCHRCISQGNYKSALKQKCVKNSMSQTLLAVLEAKIYQWKKTYNKIDYYICPSKFFRDKYREAKFTKNPIEHITNFLPRNTEYKKHLDNDNYFLYFGRLSKEKGLMSLVKAYSKCGFNSKLYLVGEGPLRADLEEYVRENNLTEKVIFTGFQSGENLKKYIAKAKGVVLPSQWYENCPYTVLEAMAMGKPVIVSDCGGMAELVNHGENGFVCRAFNDKSLQECLEKLEALPKDKYEDMCERALEKVKVQSSSENYYNKLIKIYEDLIEMRK